MEDKKKVAKNYLFNTSYQFLALVVPLITTPYISRVLKAEGIGLYSFTYSIVSYFTLFAVLGTATYGNKQIGILQDKPEERSKKFWDIFSLRFFMGLFTLICYLTYVAFFSEFKTLAYIQSFYILSIMLDISWFFQGVGDFKRISIRNYVFKLISIMAIFLFVKEETDLWKYVLSLSVLTWIGNISVWPYLKKYIVKLDNYRPMPFKGMREVIQLFVPTVAMQIYAIIDKTMIGTITDNPAQNGYYEQSEKIVKMSLMLVTSLSTVVLPEISKAFIEKKTEEVKKYLYQSYNFVWFLGTPLMFGVAAIAPILVPVFLGEGFDPVVSVLVIMSLLFVVMGINMTTGTQFFVASGRQNEYTKRILIGGMLNIAVNLILIPHFGAIGAAVGSVAGEVGIMISEMLYFQKHKILSVNYIFRISGKYVCAGLCMFSALKIMLIYLKYSVINLILCIGFGAILYCVLLVLNKDSFIWGAVNIVRKKIKKC